jgi:glycosyltransferase involved in cell wall biosynthesis
MYADAVGGVFNHALELARALTSRGVRIALATDGARLTADQRQAVDEVPGIIHHEAAWRLEWMEDPWLDIARAGEWLLALERRERPDVVHLNAFAHGALPFRAPRIVVGHSCVLSWFEAVKRTDAPRQWDRYRLAAREGLRAADAVAAPSEDMARALVRHHGPIPRPAVIPNGRDPERFPPGPKEPLVLGAGRIWDEAKNMAALLRIAPSLEWPVVIAGDATAPAHVPVPVPAPVPGNDPDPDPDPGFESLPFQAQVSALPPPGPASLLGRLPEPQLARWLARAAIFVHPSRYEPFGLAVLEAALAGCALVLGDIDSLRENWDGAAVFAPPGDDGALAADIRALSADPARRDLLAAEARRRALRLGPERMAEGYLALYRAAGAARGGARR